MVEGTVELAGHDPVPRVADLVALAGRGGASSQPRLRHGCWACADDGTGMGLEPRVLAGDGVSVPWMAEDDLADGDGRARPAGLLAVLVCAARWSLEAAGGDAVPTPTGVHVRWFRDLPVLEPVRVVARADTVGGQREEARAAIVGDGGTVHAVTTVVADTGRGR